MSKVGSIWREKALRMAALLAKVAALDDGDEPFAWEHEDLFDRIRAELEDTDPSATGV